MFMLAIFCPNISDAYTVSSITWDTIGLDSNDVSPPTPNLFPVGARVCGGTANATVDVTLNWLTSNSYIDLKSGTKGAPGNGLTITFPATPNYGIQYCADAYFVVEVQRDANVFNTNTTNNRRQYQITAGSDSLQMAHELYVEKLVSQGRNGITDIKVGTTYVSPSNNNLVSVPNGGSFSLLKDNTYFIQLVGFTATSGYEQLEAFINFDNTVIQILSVETYGSAPGGTKDTLYADACGWEANPSSPSYRSCTGSGKFGGNICQVFSTREPAHLQSTTSAMQAAFQAVSRRQSLFLSTTRCRSSSNNEVKLAATASR